MAKLAGTFSLLLPFVCISPLPLSTAGAPKRIPRTPLAHVESRCQRQLTDIVDVSRPPLHMFDSKVHFAEKEKRESRTGTDTSNPPIKYRGGPVMTGNPSINVYIIYYGSWSVGSGQSIIENFLRSLSADLKRQGGPADPKVKRWWAISTAYTQEGDNGAKNVSSKVWLCMPMTVY
ncbi:unnamed protein product [Closterium sp. NIES-54]